MSGLKIIDITSGYNDFKVLHNISFNIMGGEILALTGPNGSGKSTLLKTMCRVLKPYSGSILLNEKDIWSYNEREVAKEIAWVSQSIFFSWSFTVKQVVEMGRFPHKGWIGSYNKEDYEAVNTALEETGLFDLKYRLINTLSGGEIQRVMIGRALAQTPRILLLDEPVAHLDLKHKIAILDLLKTLSSMGLAIVISIHDLNLASIYADKIVLLKSGKLFAMGEPNEILIKKNLEEVYETNVRINYINNKPFILPESSI